MISGRYANLGPEVLAEAGLVLVDQVGEGGWAAVPDNQPIRIDDGVVYVDDTAVAHGRVVELGDLRRRDGAGPLGPRGPARHAHAQRERVPAPRAGPPPRRTRPARAQDPARRTAGRSSSRGFEHSELVPLRRYVREQDPAILAVGTAADQLMEFGWVADVVLVSVADPDTLPTVDAMKAATDVVLVCRRGPGPTEVETVEGIVRLGVAPALVESTATPEDLALLLADRYEAVPVVGAGLHARLEDFLDRRQAGLASTFATRLKVGSRLVDASAVPSLHTSGATTGQVVALLLAGVAAVAAAVAVTPAGQEMFGALADQLESLW